MGPEHLRKLGIRAAPMVEVGTHRQNDADRAAGRRPGIEEVGEERLPLVFVATEREHLLELVDDEDQSIACRLVGEGQGRCKVERALVLA